MSGGIGEVFMREIRGTWRFPSDLGSSSPMLDFRTGIPRPGGYAALTGKVWTAKRAKETTLCVSLCVSLRVLPALCVSL